MIVKIVKLVFGCLFLYFAEIGLLAAEMEDDIQSPQANFPIAEQLSSTKLEKKRDKYLADHGWRLGYKNKKNGENFYLGWGQADVRQNAKSVDFTDSKVLAFEAALLTAKGAFTRLSKNRITSEIVQEFFSDDLSRAADSSPSSTIAQIGDKVLALGNASLDSLLKKLDVDPAEFTLKQKQNLAKDTIRKTVTVKAISSVSGIRPLVTFEDNKSVGVIIVYSQKLRDQATAIAKGELVANTRIIPGKLSITEQLNSSLPENKDFIFQHGVRIMQDEMGNPALVSFAQSGVKATATTSKFQLDLALKAARSAAKNLSASQLAEFVKATVNLQDSTVMAESKMLDRITEGDMESEEENLNTGKIINTYLKQVARVNLSGVTTFKAWTANHPETGHLIVGEVSVWSPYLSNISKSINAKSSPTKAVLGKNVENKIRTSVNFESDASF